MTIKTLNYLKLGLVWLAETRAVLVLYNLDKNNPINKKLGLPTYPLLLFKKVSRKTGILFFGLN
jgi:hypothetical protein